MSYLFQVFGQPAESFVSPYTMVTGQPEEPSALDGFWSGAGKGVVRGVGGAMTGLGVMARSPSILQADNPVKAVTEPEAGYQRPPEVLGPKEEFVVEPIMTPLEGLDEIGQLLQKGGHWLKQQFAPNPLREGWATHVVAGAGEMFTTLVASPWGTGLVNVATSAAVDTMDGLQKQGVDDAVVAGAGAIDFAANLAGAKLALATTGAPLAKNMLRGASSMTAFGEVHNASIYGLLKANGYDDQARQYEIFDAARMRSSALSGALFGALDHGRMSLEKHFMRDAVLASDLGEHAALGAGVPVDAVTEAAHAARVRTGLEQIGRGEEVNVEPFGKAEELLLEPSVIPEEQARVKTGVVEEGASREPIVRYDAEGQETARVQETPEGKPEFTEDDINALFERERRNGAAEAEADADAVAQADMLSASERIPDLGDGDLHQRLMAALDLPLIPELVQEMLPQGHPFFPEDAQAAPALVRRALPLVDGLVTDLKDRLIAAASMAAKWMQEDALMSKRNTVLDEQANNSVRSALSQMLSKRIPLFGKEGGGGLLAMSAFSRLLQPNLDGKSPSLNLSTLMESTRNKTMTVFRDVFHASGKFLGLFENKAFTHDMVREAFHQIFGVHYGGGESLTGNKKAVEGAKLWSKTMEGLLKEAQLLGSKVKSLVDRAFPMAHDASKVARAGGFMGDAARDAWVNFVLPLLNQNRYRSLDGRVMTDAQLRQMLGDAWKSIATEGYLEEHDQTVDRSVLPVAGRRKDQHRVVHFADGDAWLKYAEKFSSTSLWDTLAQEVAYQSKQIALLKMFGPDGKANFHRIVDAAAKIEVDRDATRLEPVRKDVEGLKRMLDYQSGDLVTEASRNRWSKLNGIFHNLLIGTMGGGFFIHALCNDRPLLALGAKLYNIPQIDMLRAHLVAATSSEARTEIDRMGVAGQDYSGELKRFFSTAMADAYGTGVLDKVQRWTAGLPNLTLKVSLLHGIDKVTRGTMGMILFSKLAEVTGAHERLADVPEVDRRVVSQHGMTEENFAVFKRAKKTDWGGFKVVDPDSVLQVPAADIADLVQARHEKLDTEWMARISEVESNPLSSKQEKKVQHEQWAEVFARLKRGSEKAIREDAVHKLLALSTMEENAVVPTPTTGQREYVDRSFSNTTFLGVLGRSTLMFKGFALAQFTNSVQRLAAVEGGLNKFTMAASMMGMLTLGGIANVMLADFLKGKNPRNFLNPEADHWMENWLAAVLRGGSLGLAGDVLFGESGRRGFVGSLLGPQLRVIDDIYELTIGAAHKGANGQDPHVGAHALQVARELGMPMQNVWYARVLLDHLFFHEMQEMVSAGYLNRIERAAQKHGQSYWWKPGGLDAPMSAPDLTQIYGD